MAQPIRTCLGCRTTTTKEALWRFAIDGAGVVRIDSSGKLPGRGAYCCRNAHCMQRFIKDTKRLSRAFRLQVQGWETRVKGLLQE